MADRKWMDRATAVAAAIGVTLAMWGVRQAADVYLGGLATYATFLIGIVIVAAWRGWLAGLTATLLSVPLGLWFFVPPRHTFALTPARAINVTSFLLLGITVSLFFEALHRIRRRLEISNAERARALESTRAASEHLRIVTDSMSAPVTRCSRDFRYRWVSRPYAEWIGLPAGQIVGRPIAEIVGAAAFDQLRPHFDRVLSGETVRFEEQIDFRTLGPRWVQAVYTPTRDREGIVDGWVAVVHDVDVRRRSQDQLRDEDRRKDEFLATLAHELRNPLAPLRSAVDILRRGATDEPTRSWAHDVMSRQLDHMVRLVDDLLDLSRVTRGVLELQRGRVDIALVIAHAVETNRAAIDAAGHRLDLSLSGEALLVDGDAVRLTQVFSNLLNNAAKFTEPGGRIELTGGSADGQAVIVVRDSGPGIPPGMEERIFDVFVQGDRSRGGLGIGLTLVRQIVELHGGRVQARGAAGRGSEFEVALPLTSKTTPAALDRRRRVRGATRRGVRVLVVDDNPDAAASIGTMLRLMGCDVEVAGGGREALERAGQRRLDAILLDLGMPDLDGYEVARRVRSEEWGRDVRLVALTGWGNAEDRRRSREAGFDAHLVKPASPEQLSILLLESEPAPAH